MSNKEIINRPYTINCRKDVPYVFIVRPNDTQDKNIRVMMMEITEEQEKELDSGRSLSLDRGELHFVINPELCYAYGELDLSPNSKDLQKMDDANWFGSIDIRHFLLSEYDYHTHTVESDIPTGRWYSSNNVKSFMPYLYACINKPKRVAIFKEYLNMQSIRIAKNKAKSDTKYYKEQQARKKEASRIKREAQRRAKLNTLKFNIKTNIW